VPVDLQKDSPEVVACYKPRLAALLAESLDDKMKARFCLPNPSYVSDSALERALVESGAVTSIRTVKAKRPSKGKTGEYYLIPRDFFPPPVTLQEALVPPDPDQG